MAIKCKLLLTTFIASFIVITAFQIYYKMFHYIPNASALLLIFLFSFFPVDLLMLHVLYSVYHLKSFK
jgi:hypothetical protein